LTVVIFGLLVIIGTIIVDIKNKSEDFEQLKNEKKESSFWNLVAIQENFSYLITTEVPKNAFTSIYGLRAISMLWVIAGHNTLYAMIITDNQQLMFETYGHYLNSFISTSIIIADFFFVFGGFLLSYSFFEQMIKSKPKNLITFCFDRIVKRYIRLNPPFMIIIVMSIVLGIYLNDTSSFILYEDLEGNCKQYWWRNLLLIQNWFSRHEMCMSWSWFVAADFQLYAFTTLMLAVYIKLFITFQINSIITMLSFLGMKSLENFYFLLLP
jgi:peptidoglycan/LPS O-acetylase OafA/YrhL